MYFSLTVSQNDDVVSLFCETSIDETGYFMKQLKQANDPALVSRIAKGIS
jgi:hypothetical protein